MRRTRSFLGCLCYGAVPRSFWVSASSLWTVFLAQVNFRQQEGKEQPCPHDSRSRVQSEGWSFSSVSSELKSPLCSSIPRAPQNAGNGSRVMPGLPGGAKPWDGLEAASSPATCRGGSGAARPDAASGAESSGAGAVQGCEGQPQQHCSWVCWCPCTRAAEAAGTAEHLPPAPPRTGTSAAAHGDR